ncbi:MAG: Phosphoheptose isomerase [Pseudomonadales bacterium]|nr:Phosphoheptose isomerase [Pseudomonadales bacterium]
MDQLDDPLQSLFAAHVDAVYRTLDALYTEVQRAVDLLADSLLCGHRVLVCGVGAGTTLAQAFAAALLNRTRIDRPGLPVILIGAESAAIGAIAESYGVDGVFSRQVRALGQPGDVLVLIQNARNTVVLGPAALAAHAREMRVVVLSAEDGERATGALASEDVELRVPVQDPLRAGECQQLLLDALAELLEIRLFGPV